ncbi:MAG: hydrogenase maturation nickel metallochaperone HypA [Tepidisphaera sp.]
MARGKKRMWAGVTLVSLGLLAAGMVVASRWYIMEIRRTNERSLHILILKSGETRWHRYPVEKASGQVDRTSDPTRVPDGFSAGRVDVPEGPLLVVSDHATLMSRTLIKVYGRDGDGTSRWFVAGGWRHDGETAYVAVVAWPIPLFLLIAGVVPLWSGWRVRRRVRSGACLGCGYDLSATPGPAPCPECGAQRFESETGRSMRNAPGTS